MSKNKPSVDLTNVDGNAFAIVGKVRKALKASGYSKDEIKKYEKEAMSGTYDNLLAVTHKWINVEYN